jgi:hypothetical protein
MWEECNGSVHLQTDDREAASPAAIITLSVILELGTGLGKIRRKVLFSFLHEDATILLLIFFISVSYFCFFFLINLI